jgi:amino acid transporter
LWSATAVVIGDTIGSGVFLVTNDMARAVGSQTQVFAAWVIGGLIVLCGAFCYAELGAAFPKAGGPHVYLNRGLGPLWGFLFGWMSSFLERPVAMAVSALGALHVVVLTGARVPYAMARDGVFFRFAERVHPSFRTPSGSLLFLGSVAALLALSGTFEELYSLFAFAVWIFFALRQLLCCVYAKKSQTWLARFGPGAIPGRR